MKRVIAIVCVSFLVTISAYSQVNSPKCKVRRIVVVPYPFQNGHAQRVARAFTTAAAMNPCFSLNDIYSLLDDASSPALAAVDRAQTALHKGIRAFTSGSYKQATGLFQQAADAFLPNYTASGMSRDVTETFLYLGSSLAVLNRMQQAKDAFLTALTLDPAADIFSVTNLPDATELFQEVQSGQENLATGGVSIASSPAGGLVYVDGSFKGGSPMSIQGLHVGKHVVSLMMVGFQRETRVVNVLPGTTVSTGMVEMKPTARAPLLSEEIRRLLSGDNNAYVDAKGLVASDLMLVCHQANNEKSISLFDLNRRVVFSHKGWTNEKHNVQMAKQILAGLFREANKKLHAVSVPLPAVHTSSSIVKKWWFWTAIGVAVAGGTTAAILLTRHRNGSSGMDKNGTGSIILKF